jgi:hypothetical protein
MDGNDLFSGRHDAGERGYLSGSYSAAPAQSIEIHPQKSRPLDRKYRRKAKSSIILPGSGGAAVVAVDKAPLVARRDPAYLACRMSGGGFS